MSNFPKHNIDPRKKTKDWCKQFMEAAYNSYSVGVGDKIFYKKAPKYEEIKQYAHGKQSIAKYKKIMGVDEETNTTASNIDFKIFSIIRKMRQTALGRLQKSSYNIVATTIDTMARNEMDQYYADIKAKLLMKKAVEEQMPEMANHPMLQLEVKDPQDLEELEMQSEYGFKHNMAIEAEDAVNLGFAWNDINRLRERVFENLFDDGVSVYKDWIDASGKPRVRVCDNRNIVCNYCNYSDFQDLLYMGEVVEMPFHTFQEEAQKYFTSDEIEHIYESAGAAFGNVSSVNYGGRGYDKRKVWVLDLQWYSVNDTYFESRIDKRGNEIVAQVPFDKAIKNPERYKRRSDTVVYKGKWIVGTEYVYACGLLNDVKRTPKEFGKAMLDYHVEAINFHNMECKGIMEDLIPIADQIEIAWLKWQNIQNSLLPYLIEIDLDALEDVAIGAGGEVLKAKEVLDMAFQNGILVTRRRDISEKNINYQSVNFIETNYGAAVAEAWNNLVRVISMVNEIIGLNELTDASTPNPKILTNPALLANEGTNNALYNITSAEKKLLLKLANAMVKRMQQAVKKGDVKGYLPALGNNTIKFIQLSPNLDLHEFGIILEDKPTDDKKQMLQQEILKYMAEGLLEPQDAILIENEPNLKRAGDILAYRIRKRKEQRQKEALQMQQMNAQTQIQSAQEAEKAKQGTLQLEYQFKAELLKMEKEYDLELKRMELGIKHTNNTRDNETKLKLKDKDLGKDEETGEGFMPESLEPPEPEEQNVEENSFAE